MHMQNGFRESQIITKRHAKTFYLASLFLSKEQKYAVYSIYAICRLSDESVDKESPLSKIDKLNRIKNDIDKTYSGTELNGGLLEAFRSTVAKYRIPKDYFTELINGMRMDLEINSYETFDGLSLYCYRVAGVIGLIILDVFGYKDSEAKEYAIRLGVALQLTNIIRDIKEDFKMNRIYLPKAELKQFGVTAEQLACGKIDTNFKELIKFEIARARIYYEASQRGIRLISDLRARFVTCLIKELYAEILTVIEKSDYDVFSKRAHVNISKKMYLVLKVILKGRYL